MDIKVNMCIGVKKDRQSRGSSSREGKRSVFSERKNWKKEKEKGQEYEIDVQRRDMDEV